MGTFPSVRGALALALLLLALLFNGDMASAHRGREDMASVRRRLQDAEAKIPWYHWPNATADDKAAELLLYGTSFANETDPASAAIARRTAAVGVTYGYARWWLSLSCPRRGKDGTLSGITRRCYLRGLRSLEESARPRPPPPPETPEEEARHRVIEILTTTTQQVYPWPDKIRNPVIKTRYRTYPVPSFPQPQFRWY